MARRSRASAQAPAAGEPRDDPLPAGHPAPEAGAPVVPAITTTPSPAAPVAAVPTESSLLRVALLLAVAAIAAAIVGARVSMLSGEASGKWQSDVRLEMKRSAGAQETVRYLYDVEVPAAIKVIEGRLILAQLAALPESVRSSSQAVQMEQSVQTEVLKALEPSSDLTEPGYTLPAGGVDLGKRLADIRAGLPGQLALDPEGTRAQGDRLASKAADLSLALVPFGLCAFLGALAQAFAGRRRLLLGAGWTILSVGLVAAIAMEALL